MSQGISSLKKRFAHYSVPTLMLLVFIIAMVSDGIQLPSRHGEFTLSRDFSKSACLFPIFWLAGIFIGHDPLFGHITMRRIILSAGLQFIGVLLFMYTVWRVSE